MRLYDAHERPLRRTLGFTGGEIVARHDGDETTVVGLAQSRGEPLRSNGCPDQGHDWEDPRCRKPSPSPSRSLR